MKNKTNTMLFKISGILSLTIALTGCNGLKPL